MALRVDMFVVDYHHFAKTGVYEHVYKHVRGHAYRLVYRHGYVHECLMELAQDGRRHHTFFCRTARSSGLSQLDPDQTRSTELK